MNSAWYIFSWKNCSNINYVCGIVMKNCHNSSFQLKLVSWLVKLVFKNITSFILFHLFCWQYIDMQIKIVIIVMSRPGNETVLHQRCPAISCQRNIFNVLEGILHLLYICAIYCINFICKCLALQRMVTGC